MNDRAGLAAECSRISLDNDFKGILGIPRAWPSKGHRCRRSQCLEASPEFNHSFSPGHQRGRHLLPRARELYQCNSSVPLSGFEAAASAPSNAPTNVVPLESPRSTNPFPRESEAARLVLSSWNRDRRTTTFSGARCEWRTSRDSRESTLVGLVSELANPGFHSINLSSNACERFSRISTLARRIYDRSTTQRLRKVLIIFKIEN